MRIRPMLPKTKLIYLDDSKIDGFLTFVKEFNRNGLDNGVIINL